MGITIHYDGVLKNPKLIQPIINEIEDICKSMNWKCQYLEKAFPLDSESFKNEQGEFLEELKMRGVSFMPPESEPFFFTFTPEGRLVSFLKFIVGVGKNNDMMGECLSTKTQFAGVEVHMVAVKMLKFLSKKYFKEFNVYDEAKYWETGDEKEARRLFSFLDGAIEAVAAAFEADARPLPDDDKSLIERIEEIIKKLNPDDF